jgi:predicted DNA-binding protein (UPF0251 family)
MTFKDRERSFHFETAIGFTRFKPKMMDAVKMVVLHDFTYAAAGRKYEISRQSVHKAVKSFYKTCQHLSIPI